MKHIEENNKLIAEFMSEPIYSYKWIQSILLGRDPEEKFIKHDGKYYLLNNLKYHESWNWLMPVVTMIEKEHDYFSCLECIGLGIYDFTISQYYKENADELELPEGLLVRTDERATDFKDARLEAVYRGVIQFIKWYNEQENDG